MRKMVRIIAVNVQALYASGPKSKSGNNMYLWLMPLLGVVFVGYSVGISFGMAAALKPLGAMWALPALLYLLCFMLTLVTGLYQIGGLLFTGKDMEQLLALPVRKWQIIFCKLCSVVIENLVTGLIVLGPGLIIYAVNQQPGPEFILCGLLGWLFSPLLPMVIAVAIAYLINLLSVGSRFKTLFNIVFTSAWVVALTILPQMLIRNFATIMTQSVGVIGGILRYIPPIRLILDATVSGSLVSLLGYMLINALPFALLVALLAKGFHRVWARGQSGRKRPASTLRYSGSGKFAALFKKEAGRYFSSYPYVLNTAMGMVLMTVFSVAAVFSGPKALEMLNLPGIDSILLPMVTLMFCFMAGISATTPSSISIEGHTLWIVKSCPTPVRSLLLAKFALSMLVTGPVLLIDSLVISYALRLGFAGWLVVCIIPLLLSAMMGLVGLIANLKMPRMDLKNDMQIVKQSPSVMVAVFSEMGLMAVVAVLYALLSRYVTFYAFAAIAAVLMAAVTWLLYRYVVTKGVQLFEAIQ